MSNQVRATAHFDRSFFESTPEIGLHLPTKENKENPFPLHYFAIQNDALYRLKGGQEVPAGAETDLRKIRDFVFAHLAEVGQVPLPGKDNPVMRIYDRLLAVDLLIGKHNSRLETTKSSPIEPLVMKQIDRLKAILDTVDTFLVGKEKAAPERFAVQQEFVGFARALDSRLLPPIYARYPGLKDAFDVEWAKHPPTQEVQQIQALVEVKPFLAFYRSGPMASLSMFAECPNGVQIYGKRFSCVASAFEYKRCQEAGCTEGDLEKFTTLKGEEAVAYGKTLTKGEEKPSWTSETTFPSQQWKVMDEIVQAKYAQNRGMLSELVATGNANLVCHAPEGATEKFWSDGSNGSGRNELGAILERARSIARGGSAPEAMRVDTGFNDPSAYVYHFNRSVNYPIF